jgi:hypothetical protein
MIGRGSIARTEAWQHEAVVSPETTRPAQMAKLFGYLKGMHATCLLDLGVRLRLFQRLGEAPGGLHAADLAAAGSMDAGYTRCWCETACALELLDYDPEAGYRLAPFMDELLARPEATFSLAGFPTAHLLVQRLQRHQAARDPDAGGSVGSVTGQLHRTVQGTPAHRQVQAAEHPDAKLLSHRCLCLWGEPYREPAAHTRPGRDRHAVAS